MDTARSVGSSLANGNQQQQVHQMVAAARAGPRQKQTVEGAPRAAGLQNGTSSQSSSTSPICRCRVMYLGSSVPHITKDGLQGIQEPLRELYPDQQSLAAGNAGIDSWLSVWSNGILIENVDETGRELKRFFKIEALHYCAAVKYIARPDKLPNGSSNGTGSNTNNNDACSTTSSSGLPKFLPLDSPHARLQQADSNPPIFASILRRTTGVKVLECHAFICKREAAANALVRCCFHAYADTMYAKQIGADMISLASSPRAGAEPRALGQTQTLRRPAQTQSQKLVQTRRSRSIAALNEPLDSCCDQSDSSNNNNNNSNNCADAYQTPDYQASIMRRKSMNETLASEQAELAAQDSALRRQYQLSKSLHQLNQAEQVANGYANQLGAHSSSIHNLASSKARWGKGLEQAPEPQPGFHNPYASRVPSYPPQNLLELHQQKRQQQASQGGTLRSIRSVAANSIASTLLRSKKHAKAMSAAQLQQQQQQLERQHELARLPGFHQPHLAGSATLAPSQSFMMPPVPPMFLPRVPLLNGSHTMKLPRAQVAAHLQPLSFETMSPKEMKKLLKKSAKYGLDPTKYGLDPSLASAAGPGAPALPMRAMPPPPPPLPSHMTPASLQSNKSGTMNSQSVYSLDHLQQQQPSGQDFVDFHHQQQQQQQMQDAMLDTCGFAPVPPPQLPPPPIKSILVKPNPEFLKSRAGKKWLKQQKEFKKLLPPHLDGLPIVFGPPPMDALELAAGDSSGLLPAPAFLAPPPVGQHQQLLGAGHPGVPVMDSSGYYAQQQQQQQQPMYLLPSGRASNASTLLRYSPHSMLQQQQQQQFALDDSFAHQPTMMPGGQHDAYALGLLNGAPNLDHLGQPLYAANQLAMLDNNQRQYVFNNDPIMNQRRRRHMVEQSVISLGDENDGDDDDEEHEERLANGANQHQLDSNGRSENQAGQDEAEEDEEDDHDSRLSGYYNHVTEPGSSAAQEQQQQQQRRRYRDDGQNYEQLRQVAADQLQNDADQGSYSSGIYRRGHLNERAFSYSIRQEHKSGSRADEAEHYAPTGQNYSNQPDHLQHINNNNNNNGHYQASIYDNQQMVYQNASADNAPYQKSMGHGRHVDELSARIEKQLTMRSFANGASSRIR